MAEQASTKTLTAGHRQALGLESETKREAVELSHAAKAYYDRRQDLKNVPPHIVRQAWFTLAHLILPEGSKVAHMGCGDGEVTYAMAKLHPGFNFVGIDAEKKAVAKARLMYNLPNLSFEQGDMSGQTGVEEGSLDAIVNSYVLHKIYTAGRYNERQVTKALEHQFSLLKPEGLMFIRDYALRLPGEYVLMEMPDDQNGGDDVLTMSEADLLVWYSENARPDEVPGCKGFFLEELPPRFPQTRLFRLTYKWAYEFIIRKDNRANLEAELYKEHSFFTERDFRKNLRAMGARALYTAPHWDENTVKERYDGRFNLLDEHGEPLGAPPTSFVVVAQKTGETKSLRLMERRPSSKSDGRLRITTMRNEKTGRLVDIATRDLDVTDIMPYRVTSDGQLHVFVHEAIPRGIVNAVPRIGRDLDGKRWSGHMVEAIGVPSDIIHTVEQGGFKETVKFAREFLGLTPTINTDLENGPSYYPAPEFIDEMVKTRYLQVREHKDAIIPKVVMDDVRGFSSYGRIREVNAQQLLDAISVGYLPNARLELQILNLYDQLKMKAETWEECPLVLEESDPDILFDGLIFAKLKAEKDDRFKPVRGSASNLRMVNSVFVDEGWQDGAATGMASRDMGFVISEEETLNKAVILPLTRKAGQLMVGFETVYMPAPQRAEGNGLHIKAPSINLPKHITNIHEAQKYVAETFKVPLDNVWRLGERYYCHPGVTPLRIYPFAIATTGSKTNPTGGPVQFAPVKYLFHILFRVLDWRSDQVFLSALHKVQRRIGVEGDMQLKRALGRALQAQNTAAAVTEATNIDGLAEAKDEAKSDAKSEVKSEKSSEKAATEVKSENDNRKDSDWHLNRS